MAVYYLFLLGILVLAYPLCIRKPSKGKTILYLAITLGYMWVLSTFRYGIGYDYMAYIDIFQTIKEAPGISGVLALQWEPGFMLLTKLMTLFITSNVVMYGVYAAIILLPIGWFIYRYCKDAWISVWLFVTMTFFYTSMNFVRQSIACSIIALAYPLLRDKKLIPYMLTVLLAASFQKTALIMIPVYFVCHFKLNKKWGIFYGSATLLAFLFARPIWDLVTTYIYSYYQGTIWEGSFPAIYLLVPFTVFGACLALWSGWRKRFPEADMLLNLMMYSAIIWLFITKMFILERFSMYIYLFALVAVPQALSSMKAPEEDIAHLADLRVQLSKKASQTKADVTAVRTVELRIKERKQYYWSAVVALLALTIIYHEFGAFVSGTFGFHGVFPYHSVIPWLNSPGTPPFL